MGSKGMRALMRDFRSQVFGKFFDTLELITEVFRHFALTNLIHLGRNCGRQFGEFFGFLTEEARVYGLLLECRRRLDGSVALLVCFADAWRNRPPSLTEIS